MTPERREILEKVASGDLTPEEAEFLLNAEADEAQQNPTAPTTAIRRVRITAGFGAISVVGDADVAEADIEGIHQATVDGDTLVISGDFDGVTPGAFAVSLGGRRGGRARRIKVHTGLHGRGRSAGALRVRINPSLELDARLDAGPLSISGIGAPIRARSSAGPITIDGVVAPVDVAVNAGAIRINGCFDQGDSRVRSDAGAIRIELAEGSSVRISANAALGRVALPGMKEGGRGFGSTHEAVVGNGDATLRVETAMGSIQVLER